jgi:hypothetical protein
MGDDKPVDKIVDEFASMVRMHDLRSHLRSKGKADKVRGWIEKHTPVICQMPSGSW